MPLIEEDNNTESVIQRLRNLKCPPPLSANNVSVSVLSLNDSIQLQVEQIEMLERQIVDLERRYKIKFSCDPYPIFDISSNGTPYIDKTGSLTQVNLGIHIWDATNGRQGMSGNPGLQGNQSNVVSNPGSKGNVGFYGMRGQLMK